MKKSKLIYTAIAAALLAGAISASAQSDSSHVPPLRGTPVVRAPHLPVQPAPIVNNITQVTQVVQPNTYTISSGWQGGVGVWLAAASASCDGATLISGGGQCTTFGDSWGRAKNSYPSGNSWVYECGADENGSDGTIYASATAVCSN